MLDDTTALQDSFLVFLSLEDTHVGSLDDIREVGFQFHEFARSVDDIHTTVVVEEQRAVVEVTHTRDDGPGTFCLLSREDIGVAHRPLLVGSQQRIELPVVVFQRGGPLTATVGSALLQVVLRRVCQLIEDITYRLPVLQVLRLHDGSTGHEVHGGGYEIEGVAHTDDVGVGHIRPQHGVLDFLRAEGGIVAVSSVLCI